MADASRGHTDTWWVGSAKARDPSDLLVEGSRKWIAEKLGTGPGGENKEQTDRVVGHLVEYARLVDSGLQGPAPSTQARERFSNAAALRKAVSVLRHKLRHDELPFLAVLFDQHPSTKTTEGLLAHPTKAAFDGAQRFVELLDEVASHIEEAEPDLFETTARDILKSPNSLLIRWLAQDWCAHHRQTPTAVRSKLGRAGDPGQFLEFLMEVRDCFRDERLRKRLSDRNLYELAHRALGNLETVFESLPRQNP